MKGVSQTQLEHLGSMATSVHSYYRQECNKDYDNHIGKNSKNPEIRILTVLVINIKFHTKTTVTLNTHNVI